MKSSDFEYQLPQELIAQFPAPQRDQSRLLVCDRRKNTFEHHYFSEFPKFLSAGDLVVLNNTRVIPARLRSIHSRTKKPLEVFLLQQVETNDWWVMVKPGRRAPLGTDLKIL